MQTNKTAKRVVVKGQKKGTEPMPCVTVVS
jgi:hypothetical protein